MTRLSATRARCYGPVHQRRTRQGSWLQRRMRHPSESCGRRRRYAEDSAATLEAMAIEAGTPERCLRRYPETFRRSSENGNRICLCSFMTVEYDDLPAEVQAQVQAFAEVNVAWLGKVLQTAGMERTPAELRARAIFAAVSGAQLMARKIRCDALRCGNRKLSCGWSFFFCEFLVAYATGSIGAVSCQFGRDAVALTKPTVPYTMLDVFSALVEKT